MGKDGCNERIPLCQLRKRKVVEVSDGAGKDSSCGGLCEDGDAEVAGTGNAEPVGTSGKVVDPQIPSSLATDKQEAGSGLSGLLNAVHGFNTGLPFVQKHVKGPKWMQLAIGATFVNNFSNGCWVQQH